MKKAIVAALAFLLKAFPAVHVIGDSHSREFQGIENCFVHHTGPVTMHRVGRDGMNCVNFHSYGIKENDVVVMVFGEIDVRCHVGKQRDFAQRDLDEILNTLLFNYLNTILLNKSHYENLRVLTYTVTPPTDQALNIHYPFYGTIEDRVSISKKLNSKLISFAGFYGIDVIDVYDDYADAEGALIPALSDQNVHISDNQYIRKKLSALIHQ